MLSPRSLPLRPLLLLLPAAQWLPWLRGRAPSSPPLPTGQAKIRQGLPSPPRLSAAPSLRVGRIFFVRPRHFVTSDLLLLLLLRPDSFGSASEMRRRPFQSPKVAQVIPLGGGRRREAPRVELPGLGAPEGKKRGASCPLDAPPGGVPQPEIRICWGSCSLTKSYFGASVTLPELSKEELPQVKTTSLEPSGSNGPFQLQAAMRTGRAAALPRRPEGESLSGPCEFPATSGQLEVEVAN